MRVFGSDIGCKNLAYCIFDIVDGKINIQSWDLVDLRECICNKKKNPAACCCPGNSVFLWTRCYLLVKKILYTMPQACKRYWVKPFSGTKKGAA